MQNISKDTLESTSDNISLFAASRECSTLTSPPCCQPSRRSSGSSQKKRWGGNMWKRPDKLPDKKFQGVPDKKFQGIPDKKFQAYLIKNFRRTWCQEMKLPKSFSSSSFQSQWRYNRCKEQQFDICRGFKLHCVSLCWNDLANQMWLKWLKWFSKPNLVEII